MSIFINRTQKALSVAGALVTLSDLATPILPFSAYFITISILIITGLLIYKNILNKWNEPCAITMYLCIGIFLLSSIIFYFQQQNDNYKQRGIIASNIDIVSNLQESLSIIQRSINKIEKNTASIDTKMDSLKKEVSDDPKKELSNRGISWTRSSFLESIYNGDIETLRLFIDGGFSTNLYSGATQNIFIKFIHDTPEDKFESILNILYEKNFIVPNKEIIITWTPETLSDPEIPYTKIYSRGLYYYQENTLRQAKNHDSSKMIYPSFKMKVNMLILAVWEGNKKYIKFLLDKGENSDFIGLLDATNTMSPKITPISEAIFLQRKEIEKLLNNK